MSSQIKAKLLQHFAGKKKANGGFTLIELLVVIIIIGILSAIALPSFLNQANKAKQSEAKTYVGSMNRAQQAYYLENDTFADDASFARLGLGIATETANYTYEIAGGGAAVTNQAQPLQGASASIKAYVGGVKVGRATSGTGTGAVSEATTIAILCEAEDAPVITASSLGDTEIEYGTTATDAPTCQTDYKAVN